MSANKNTVKLSVIAKSVKVDTKTARRRLRASGMRRPKAGWEFSAAKRGEVAKIVKG